MAAPTSPTSPRKAKKDDSLFDKIGGTINRKKKGKEATEVVQEGKNAIEGSLRAAAIDLGPDAYLLEDNEERSMIEPTSRDDPKVKDTIRLLLEWINDELAGMRIVVKDIEEDLFDGQILQILIEKLEGIKIEVSEVSQSEVGQKQKLRTVLDHVNAILNITQPISQQKWTVDTIHSKNLVAILHLLIALARHYRAPIRLCDNLVVTVIVVAKRDGKLESRRVLEELTGELDDFGLRSERDAFDTLFDHAPDKLNVVKKSLVGFVNKHLSKLHIEVTELESDFQDGVYLVLLMGLLEAYFVPLFHFHMTPSAFDQRVHNVQFVFELMQDAGLPQPKARPEDIVNGDLKSTLRVLYNLFTKYKALA